MKKRNFIIVGILVAGILIFFFREPIRDFLLSVLNWFNDNKVTGAFLITVCYQAFPFLLMPITILTISVGFIYGPVLGTAIVAGATTLSCIITFLTGRFFFKSWVDKKMESNHKLKAVNMAISDEGWKVVVLSRFALIVPFILMNFVFGASRVSFLTYTFFSFLGMLPGTILYVYSGSVLSSLSGVSERQTNNGFSHILLGVSVLLTLALIVYLTRKARSLIRKYEEKEASDG